MPRALHDGPHKQVLRCVIFMKPTRVASAGQIQAPKPVSRMQYWENLFLLPSNIPHPNLEPQPKFPWSSDFHQRWSTEAEMWIQKSLDDGVAQNLWLDSNDRVISVSLSMVPVLNRMIGIDFDIAWYLAAEHFSNPGQNGFGQLKSVRRFLESW